jgi:heterodisulfide reductase subunit A
LNSETKKVMVIGGGIAGLTAAWELAAAGVEVALVEKAAFLGGHAIQYACKATDECQQCGACGVEKMLANVIGEPRIRVYLAAEAASVSGEGPFTVTLRPSGVQPEPQATAYDDDPAAFAAARGYSTHNTVFYGPDGRFDPQRVAAPETLTVAAVVVATGFVAFDANQKPTYRYRELANVVTGLDLERAKRVYGDIRRPSDGRLPQKVAFIQCVGSRDERLGHLWCSQACCPYALRSALATKYKHPDMDITVFYMDIQNTGNAFSAFYEKCRQSMRFVRTIPVDMYEAQDGGIRTRFMLEEDGSPVDETFDLVVLSVGIMPGADNPALAETFGIDLGQEGFFARPDVLNTSATDRSGLFVAGTAGGPMTISGAMAHAGQSATAVLQFLGRA